MIGFVNVASDKTSSTSRL